MTAYKSSVLTTYVGDQHCDACKFLDGDRSEAVLLEVIRILDLSLAECEEQERVFMALIVEGKQLA